MPRILLVLLLLVAASCGGGDGGAGMKAVTTLYPLEWIAQEVAPDAELVSLRTEGDAPHRTTISDEQSTTLTEADVVLYMGDLLFQPPVEAALRNSTGTVLSVAGVAGDDGLLEYEDKSARTRGVTTDPHLWLNAATMANVAVAAGEAFASRSEDDAKADEYRANGMRVAQELAGAAEQIEQALRTCRRDTVAVGHQAYAYLLAPFELRQIGLPAAGDEADARARLVRQIQRQDLPAVLVDPQIDAELGSAVADEAGVDVIEISSLEVVTAEQAEKGLPRLLVEQAEAVAAAADCG